MKIKISNEDANYIKEQFDLVFHGSFTNTEPSDLCYEYRVETSYSLNNNFSRGPLIEFINTKDKETHKIMTQSWIIVNFDTFGIDEDESRDSQEDQFKTLYKILPLLRKITNLDLAIE